MIKTYNSLGPDYREAFSVFLAHTDQKAKASAWLEKAVAGLPTREVCIDAGAGNGKLTGWLQAHFPRTIAVEPNPSLCKELRAACPTAEMIAETIAAADLGPIADFVLCSHVFYYIDRPRWPETLHKLASWLRPGGVLVIALQNHETDCMRMLRHFTGEEFDLSALAQAFAAKTQGKFDVHTETVTAHIQTPTFEPAYVIAEFMLNLLPLPNPPSRADLERYVTDHFRSPEGGYRFSCHQDFLRVCRKA